MLNSNGIVDDDGVSVNCCYYNVGSLNAHEMVNGGGVFVLHQNVRSFNANFDEFSSVLSQIKRPVDVLLLSETWFNDSYNEGIEGYTSFHAYRTVNCGGGVSLYIGNHIDCVINEKISSISDALEIISVEILIGDTIVNVFGIYRPPSGSIRQFLSELDYCLSSVNPNHNIVLCGDFNIDLIADNGNVGDLCDLMRSHSLFSCINLPTRITDHSFTLIDHLWTNILSTRDSGVLVCNVTDHYSVFSTVPIIFNEKTFIKQFRDHSQERLDLLCSEVRHFASIFDSYNNCDVSTRTDIFQREFFNIYNRCCPVLCKTLSIKRFNKPWITNDLLSLINRKHDLYRKYREGIVSGNVVNNYNRYVTNMLRKAKLEYFRNKFSNSVNDINSQWRTINNLLGNKRKKNQWCIKDSNNIKLTNPKIIADKFNNFFVSIATNISSSLAPAVESPLAYMGARNPNTFFAEPCSVSEVTSIISSFTNKACNIHNVPVFIFKLLNDILSPLVGSLFNSSVVEGKFPCCLKKAIVIPLFKAGDRMTLNNYRPISLLPTLSKILEKLMLKRALSFLNKFKIFVNSQFGFRAGLSTVDAIHHYLMNVFETIENSDYLITVLLDFRKAFDCVDIGLLLLKLNHLGFRGPIYDWFVSYLRDRRQCVIIDGVSSDELEVTRGVPQGSTLGPLLFLLYINDMSQCSDILTFTHFADDTTVTCRRSDIYVAKNNVEFELRKVKRWLDTNRLSLNIEKSSCLILSNRFVPDNIVVSLDNVNIPTVESCKFLGIYIDNKINFNVQTDKLCSKLCRVVGILRRLSRYVPQDIMKTLYYTLFYSNMIYGITAWGGAGAMCVGRIKSIQNRTIKIISSDANPYKHTNILPFDLVYKYFVLLKMHKLIHGGDETYSHIVSELRPAHSHATRSVEQQLLNLPLFRKAKCQSSFLYKGLKFWNLLPLDVRQIAEYNLFKAKLKYSFHNSGTQ